MLGSKKHTRQALSLADKKRICEIAQLLDKGTHQQVADEFNKTAERSIQRLMVTKTLREKEKWLAMDPTQLNRKRMRGGKFEALELALSLCLHEVRAQGVRLSDSLLTAHAERLRKEHNIKESDFKISNGWVQNFKRRHSIRMHTHVDGGASGDGKAGDLSFLKLASTIDSDGDHVANAAHLDGIHQLIVEGGFKPADVFHYDEHLLYFRSDHALVRTDRRRRQASNKAHGRILLGLMANTLGDAPLLACIHATPPSSFPDILYASDFVDTHPHARMTKDTFTKFILHVNTIMSMQQRRILCFLDPSPCHLISMEGHMSTICGMQTVELSNTLLAFLPPKVPPHLTPLGAGIATFFHFQYKISFLKWLLSIMDHTTSPSLGMMNVEADQSMLWSAQLWKDVPASIVKTSWRQSGWLPPAWPIADEDETTSLAESLMTQVQDEWKTLHLMLHGDEHWTVHAADVGALPTEATDPTTTTSQALDAVHHVLNFMHSHREVFSQDDVAALVAVANRIAGMPGGLSS
ncbi:Aste57867_16349 [Aphanomyces stellatus]|uniref:Aste57867_16349 protein n=1 Tax=Aphanomyces stellatus TaxID=120398 RepID=A0A485L5G1_9STRA|nr:hypothetical protein As57867_016292 [Aphanomyces stellatus]VFT93125.1 Aste57867_16349 [Aphanomyces stellatus]